MYISPPPLFLYKKIHVIRAKKLQDQRKGNTLVCEQDALLEAFYQDLDQEDEGFLRIDLLEKIMIIFTPRTVIVMEDMINLLSWSNLNLVKVR